jgi:hypothetical protein
VPSIQASPEDSSAQAAEDARFDSSIVRELKAVNAISSRRASFSLTSADRPVVSSSISCATA